MTTHHPHLLSLAAFLPGSKFTAQATVDGTTLSVTQTETNGAAVVISRQASGAVCICVQGHGPGSYAPLDTRPPAGASRRPSADDTVRPRVRTPGRGSTVVRPAEGLNVRPGEGEGHPFRVLPSGQVAGVKGAAYMCPAQHTSGILTNDRDRLHNNGL